MKWLVVEFIYDNNNVEVIPQNWLSICNTFCYWPSAESTVNVLRAIKQCKSVDLNTSSQHKIKIRSKAYGDFNKASRKAEKACDVSELSETDADNYAESKTLTIRKRSKIKNHDFLYNLSSSSDEEDVVLPRLPSPPIEEHENIQQKKKKEIIDQEEKNGKKKVPDNPVLSFSSGGSNSSSMSKLQDPKLQQTSTIVLNYADFTKLIEKLNEIRETQRIHEKILDDILKALQGVDTLHKSENNLIHNFPMSKIEELKDMDNILDNESHYGQLVKELSRIGGYDYKETTRRILNKLIKDELAQLLSFKGHKGKISFSKYKISQVIVEAVIKDKKNVSEKEVEALIGIWLSKANERIKNVKKKQTELI